MRMELIGLEAQVLGDGPYAGIAGIVVDETRNTFLIEGEGRERMVPKKGVEFQFVHRGQSAVIRGSEIMHRPEDRIKKIR